MTPDFRIIAEGEDITAAIRDRLISLTITDEAGLKSDEAQLVLDDRGRKIELPGPDQARLQIAIGYIGQLQEIGIYIVDEVTCSGPPDTISIRARAADMGSTLKGQKTRAWDYVTLETLTRTIAAEHGLEPVISPRLAGIHFTHIAQTEESDMHLITRLTREHDALASVKERQLIVAPRAVGLGAAKQIALRAGDLTSYRLSMPLRGSFKSIIASWHDSKNGERAQEVAGSGEPVHRLRHIYASKDEAARAAQAELKKSERSKERLVLTLPGNPLLIAEAVITLNGTRPEAGGKWVITKATHKLDGAGYSASIEAERSKPE